jgi:hypothetical protein
VFITHNNKSVFLNHARDIGTVIKA